MDQEHEDKTWKEIAVVFTLKDVHRHKWHSGAGRTDQVVCLVFAAGAHSSFRLVSGYDDGVTDVAAFGGGVMAAVGAGGALADIFKVFDSFTSEFATLMLQRAAASETLQERCCKNVWVHVEKHVERSAHGSWDLEH